MAPRINIIEEVETLYSKLPEVGCTGCGLCCVSPTSTLVEFIYLFNKLTKPVLYPKLEKYISKRPKLHPDYEGNLRCIFLENKKCVVHKFRTASCRVFGIPSLNELNIENMEECRNNIRITSGDGSLPYMESWLNSLFELNAKLYPYGEEPFYLTGLNIESWLDIYFDDTIDEPPFDKIRKIMAEHIDLSKFKNSYTPKTSIKEKIAKISIFNTMVSMGSSKEELKNILLTIKNDHLLTGTFFLSESEKFLKYMENL